MGRPQMPGWGGGVGRLPIPQLLPCPWGSSYIPETPFKSLANVALSLDPLSER